MKKYDLTWGESVVVRQAYLETLSGKPTTFGLSELHLFGYPKHEGHPDLVSVTKKVIERQAGITPKHVIMTNGATGGVTIAMRMYAQQGKITAITRVPPYFSIYPSMIEAAGLKHVYGAPPENCYGPIIVLDSPSNPHGLYETVPTVYPTPIIWDSVYHTKIYAPLAPVPAHDIMVGSYSKLTGLNGIRVGWIATNDDLIYQRLYRLATAEYCGLSAASTGILLDHLNDPERPFYWDSFEQNGRYKLDFNRGEFSKLEKFFAGQPVTPVGMFYYAPMDEACKRLMDKAGVQWMPGSSFGGTDDFGRFNIGQDNKLVMQAVKAVLKADKIK